MSVWLTRVKKRMVKPGKIKLPVVHSAEVHVARIIQALWKRLAIGVIPWALTAPMMQFIAT